MSTQTETVLEPQFDISYRFLLQDIFQAQSDD